MNLIFVLFKIKETKDSTLGLFHSNARSCSGKPQMKWEVWYNHFLINLPYPLPSATPICSKIGSYKVERTKFSREVKCPWKKRRWYRDKPFLVPGAALIYVTQVVYNTSLYLAVKENSFKSRCQQIRFYHDLLPKYPSS